jgi:hypothetical protein
MFMSMIPEHQQERTGPLSKTEIELERKRRSLLIYGKEDMKEHIL